MNFADRAGFFSALTAAILLSACSSTPVATAPTPKTAAPASTVPDTSQGAARPSAQAAIAAAPIAPYLDPQSQLHQKRSIYFDFDQSVVKPDFTPLLELHGKYLALHPNLAVKVQGNTDEQGGAEYNLALGQKRAEAVVKALKIYGVKDAQLEAISFGKEKPQAMGHDEAAHAQNRRADLAYPEK